MGETFTYFEGLEKLLQATDELYRLKIMPLMAWENLPFDLRKEVSRHFVDLKCDIITSRHTTKVLDRWPYEMLARRFRQLEAAIREAVSMYQEKPVPVSGKDAAAGERRENENG